ncbi:hypothetical protein L873DRAFT_1807987 [Choiromyces venosus 120613-1]|uniref:Uncharacterized protein n=1 Tax=Choiromyces venosus 120613-1 TaxID=1336337 RepID=A0A3N4JMW4_9PEZI|nr:hypothetical protein L873DRAFT_1807987 [Choiromyces venosus 120613-1]
MTLPRSFLSMTSLVLVLLLQSFTASAAYTPVTGNTFIIYRASWSGPRSLRTTKPQLC